jgi:hypothetical protein
LIKRNVHSSNDFTGLNFRGSTNNENENDDNLKKFNTLIHNNSFSQRTSEKKTMFEENILMNDDHLLKNNSEKKTKFDSSLPRIESETSLNMKNKVKFDANECRLRVSAFKFSILELDTRPISRHPA